MPVGRGGDRIVALKERGLDRAAIECGRKAAYAGNGIGGRHPQARRLHPVFAMGAASFLGLTLLAGCKPVGPNYQRPTYTAPPAYKETGASAVIPPPNPPGGGWQPATPSDGRLKGKGGG